MYNVHQNKQVVPPIIMTSCQIFAVLNSIIIDDLSKFLTLAEKQRIILHELESIRATEDDLFIPGFDEQLSLYIGEAISK